MRTITLPQPRASKLISGQSRLDLRSWSTEYRGRVAIHAGCTAKHLSPAEIAEGELPRRSILGIATLVDCLNLAHLRARQERGYGDAELMCGRTVDDVLDEADAVEQSRGGWEHDIPPEFALIFDWAVPFNVPVAWAEFEGLGQWDEPPGCLEGYERRVSLLKRERAAEKARGAA